MTIPIPLERRLASAQLRPLLGEYLAEGIDGEDLCRKVGGSTHFFQTTFSLEQEEKFVLKVHELVDEWNERN